MGTLTEEQRIRAEAVQAQHLAELESMRTEVVWKGGIEGQPVEFTWGELRDAFDLVADEENWKMPIDQRAHLPEAIDVLRMTVAVTFFAGCHPDLEPLGNGRYQVRAIGYYMAVGA